MERYKSEILVTIVLKNKFYRPLHSEQLSAIHTYAMINIWSSYIFILYIIIRYLFLSVNHTTYIVEGIELFSTELLNIFFDTFSTAFRQHAVR